MVLLRSESLRNGTVEEHLSNCDRIMGILMQRNVARWEVHPGRGDGRTVVCKPQRHILV